MILLVNWWVDRYNWIVFYDYNIFFKSVSDWGTKGANRFLRDSSWRGGWRISRDEGYSTNGGII